MNSLDDYLKIAQISFYLTTIILAVLTYRSAKRGLLNTVNTEYQKKVIERLREVSDELGSEFNEDSPNLWIKQHPVKELVLEINREFAKNKKLILETGTFTSVGLRYTPNMQRIQSLIKQFETDPFIPRKIRRIIVDLLENRFMVIQDIYYTEIENYREQLAKGIGISPEELEENPSIVHNKVNRQLYERGCGISQIEEATKQIRLTIQSYLESFNPIK